MALQNTTTHLTQTTMRRTENQTDVGFAARVPATVKQALESVLPATSGKTWFVRTALKAFNDECEPRPMVQAEVREAIFAMRSEEPPRRLEDFLVRVPVEEYTRFNQMFPEKGATTWFLRGIINQYLKQAEGLPTPDTHVQDAVRAILNISNQ